MSGAAVRVLALEIPCYASEKEPIALREMLDSLPPGEARLQRPESVVRYTYEDFEAASHGRRDRFRRANSIPIVPIEAVSIGDVQVIAAHEPRKPAVCAF